MNTFLATFGGDYARAGEAIARFREKVKAAGFPDLHLNGVLFGLGGILSQAVAALGLNSTTSYVWIHHNILPDFPATRYEKAADRTGSKTERPAFRCRTISTSAWDGTRLPDAAT